PEAVGGRRQVNTSRLPTGVRSRPGACLGPRRRREPHTLDHRKAQWSTSSLLPSFIFAVLQALRLSSGALFRSIPSCPKPARRSVSSTAQLME
ncbi:hypothetical protein LEMLEM_LOCUS7504, partial [Lemmus lemmus]